MRERTTIILGGCTYHLIPTEDGWLGYVTSYTHRVNSATVVAKTKEEVVGKLVLEKVISR